MEERYLRGPSLLLLPFAEGKLVEKMSGEVVFFEPPAVGLLGLRNFELPAVGLPELCSN